MAPLLSRLGTPKTIIFHFSLYTKNHKMTSDPSASYKGLLLDSVLSECRCARQSARPVGDPSPGSTEKRNSHG